MSHDKPGAADHLHSSVDRDAADPIHLQGLSPNSYLLNSIYSKRET